MARSAECERLLGLGSGCCSIEFTCRTELLSTRPLELVLQTLVQGLEKQSKRLDEQEKEIGRLGSRCSDLEQATAQRSMPHTSERACSSALVSRRKLALRPYRS